MQNPRTKMQTNEADLNQQKKIWIQEFRQIWTSSLQSFKLIILSTYTIGK